jgi:hypothetical protein
MDIEAESSFVKYIVTADYSPCVICPSSAAVAGYAAC